MTSKEKEYEFDKKLISNDIKFIDREEFNRFNANIRCDRHNGLLKKYVNTIRIDNEYYQIGDNCYDSIKKKLSEIRGKSLRFIRIDLEEGYDKYLDKKWSEAELKSRRDIGAHRWDIDYNRFKEMEWDFEHGNLPKFRIEEYKKLKEKIKRMKAEEKRKNS